MTEVVEKISLKYKGKTVVATKLAIASRIQLPVDIAWEKVQSSDLLNFVAKGMIKFKPVQKEFPVTWVEGQTVLTKMLICNVIPFGGIHSIHFEKIDQAKKTIRTSESNKFTKVWDHKISLEKLTDDSSLYKDEVIIYGGMLTYFISKWPKSFYKHRQKRWKMLALKYRESKGETRYR